MDPTMLYMSRKWELQSKLPWYVSGWHRRNAVSTLECIKDVLLLSKPALRKLPGVRFEKDPKAESKRVVEKAQYRHSIHEDIQPKLYPHTPFTLVYTEHAFDVYRLYHKGSVLDPDMVRRIYADSVKYTLTCYFPSYDTKTGQMQKNGIWCAGCHHSTPDSWEYGDVYVARSREAWCQGAQRFWLRSENGNIKNWRIEASTKKTWYQPMIVDTKILEVVPINP